MAVIDHEIFYNAIGDPACVVPTPNTVSRGLKTGERSFSTVVWQSGKAILDSELMLGQAAQQESNLLLQRWQVQSGWLRGQTHYDSYDDYILVTNTPKIIDDSGGSYIRGIGNTDLVNSFIFPRLEAVVGGWPVVVEYTNTQTVGYNLVTLTPPTIYDGIPGSGTVKRTDFVFLEVWPSLVPPSPRANGSVQVVNFATLAPGDKITINAVDLTAIAVGPPAASQFVIAGTDANTAYNIATAITANYPTVCYGIAVNDFAYIFSVLSGAAGNLTTLAVTVAVPGAMIASGPTFSGGADRPNKPFAAQDYLFRHGNVLSPATTWLADEIVDPIVSAETSQRIQVQYRVRSTGANEAVNFKLNPDGFSTPIGGAPPNGGIFAQGPGSSPVATYPFVPADTVTFLLNSKAAAYGVEDNGLWIAGDGTAQSAKDLGSADGFIYAIPICFVHRHNDAFSGAVKGFLPLSNTNGAPLYDHAGYPNAWVPPVAVGAGLSDRPDGHFADVITTDNILDLRRHVSFFGVDSASETKYQFQSLLDGSTRTWSIDTASKQKLGLASGDVSTRYLICNEIGKDVANGGTGETDRGVFIREFDHIARRFGDQSVVERVVVSFYPGDRAVAPVVAPGLENLGKYVTKAGLPGAAALWYEGDVLHLDLTALNPSTLGSLFQGDDGGGPSDPPLTMSACMPLGTCITDVLSAYHDDGHSDVSIIQQVEIQLTKGLGTQHLEVTLDANQRLANGGKNGDPDVELVGDAGGAVGTARRIFLEVEITYPIGEGTTDTVYHPVTPDATQYSGLLGMGPGSVIEENILTRPNDLDELLAPAFREGYREIKQEYVTNVTNALPPVKNPGVPIADAIVSRNTTDLYFPRRVFYRALGTTVTDTGTGFAKVVDDSLTEYGSSSRKVIVTAPLSGAGQTLCDIEYFAQDPVPNYGPGNTNYQLAVYFRSNSPQTAGVYEGALGTGAGGTMPTTLHVEPLFFGDVWTGQIGSGSTDRAFPYGSFSDPIPINDGDPPAIKEWYFCAASNITLDDFNSSTGLLTLHAFVQADEQNVLEFGGAGAGEPPRLDAEFRAYYPFADDSVYRPTILSQPIYGAVRHKVLVPFLARATETIEGLAGGILFRKDELLLIVLSRFAALDDKNNVSFTDTDNTTGAALYRTRNLLLLAQASRSI